MVKGELTLKELDIHIKWDSSLEFVVRQFGIIIIYYEGQLKLIKNKRWA